MPPPFRPLSPRKRAGHRLLAFSLVEVTLAIGIMAFTVLPLVALLPIGLNVNRQAVSATVGTQIVARVAHEAQQTDFSTLIDPTKPFGPFYFDDQGALLNGGSDTRRIYDVRASINRPTVLPPGSTSPSLATIKVDIAANPGRDPNIFAVAANGSFVNGAVSTYFTYVAKND